MRRIVFFLVFLVSPGLEAVTLLSTDSGASEQSIKQGVSDGIFDSFAKHAGDWVAQGMDKIGNWAIKTLFGIYDKYIGTFLIYIPDLAAPKTYNALMGLPGGYGSAATAIQVVLNVLKITSGTGIFILLVGFVIDTGQRSSGLWDRFVEGSAVISFVAAFLCLFAWPSIHSFLTGLATDMGYFVYSQNTLRISGVLSGLENIELNAPDTAHANTSQYHFRENFISSQGSIWDLIYLIAMALVVLGFYNCYSAVSAGESEKGNFKFFQAAGGLILILGTPTLVHVLIDKGADKAGISSALQDVNSQPFSMQGLIGENGIQYPSGGQIASNNGTAGNSATPPTSRLAEFSAGLLKCGAALWGLVVCFLVLFAKFFQALNIWAFLVLGPAFIGCLGHPATAPIFWGACRYFVKLLLYSVIWAVLLIGLYLIPNINWGVETIGVNSLLTAVAIIAGLQFIGNVQEFAGLFTTFAGANLKGEGLREFKRDTQTAVKAANETRLKTFGAGKALTGETAQAVATATGSMVGSVIPGLGTAGGALWGQRVTKGLNAVMQVGSLGGKPDQPSDNPLSNTLKRFSGNVISGNLAKDTRKNLEVSEKEAKKRQLIGGYAKRLQRTGTAETNRGTGGDRRDGDGHSA